MHHIQPLHSWLEYERARLVDDILSRKSRLSTLSDNEQKEFNELSLRIINYEYSCIKNKATEGVSGEGI